MTGRTCPFKRLEQRGTRVRPARHALRACAPGRPRHQPFRQACPPPSYWSPGRGGPSGTPTPTTCPPRRSACTHCSIQRRACRRRRTVTWGTRSWLCAWRTCCPDRTFWDKFIRIRCITMNGVPSSWSRAYLTLCSCTRVARYQIPTRMQSKLPQSHGPLSLNPTGQPRTS